MCWEVPNELFGTSVERIWEILSEAHEVESLRSDPAFQNSDRRRLFFVQFGGVPLFWRADIDVMAESVGRDLAYDVHNQAARGDDWSPTHSALMNAIGAVKALLRGQEENAGRLLRRGFERAGLQVPMGSTQELILELVEGIRAMGATRDELAQRIMELHSQVFGPEGETWDTGGSVDGG